MEKKSDNITFMEAYKVNNRAFLMINHHCPGMFLSIILHSVFSAILPYISIYFSARIINELAGLRRSDILVKWIVAELLVVTSFKLIAAALERWDNTKSYLWWWRKCGIFTKKFLSMDYADIDKQTTLDLYAQIYQSENWNGHGLSKLIWSLKPCLQSIFGIIGAITLTASLFSQAVPETAG